MKTKGNDPVEHILEINPDIGHVPLTKREYFAALAYQALITALCTREDNDMPIKEGAKNATKLADSLIKALNEEVSDVRKT